MATVVPERPPHIDTSVIGGEDPVLRALPYLRRVRSTGGNLNDTLPPESPFPGQSVEIKPYYYGNSDSPSLGTWQINIGKGLMSARLQTRPINKPEVDGADYNFTLWDDGKARAATPEEVVVLGGVLDTLYRQRQAEHRVKRHLMPNLLGLMLRRGNSPGLSSEQDRTETVAQEPLITSDDLIKTVEINIEYDAYGCIKRATHGKPNDDERNGAKYYLQAVWDRLKTDRSLDRAEFERQKKQALDNLKSPAFVERLAGDFIRAQNDLIEQLLAPIEH